MSQPHGSQTDNRDRSRWVATYLRVALYVVLLASAVATFAGLPPLEDYVTSGELSERWLLLPPILFTGFLILYAIDRVLLVLFRGYPPGRAFFQVVFGILFISLLFPKTWREYKEQRVPAVIRLLKHRDPEFRRIALELLGYRGDRGNLDLVDQARHDPDSRVREEAGQARRRIEGLPVSD